MKLLITFGNVAFEGYLLRNWHDSMLVAFPGAIGPYRNFMLLYRDEEAYRDVVFGVTVGIISLSHLPPGRLNGVRVSVHRQLSPEPGRQGKEGDQLPWSRFSKRKVRNIMDERDEWIDSINDRFNKLVAGLEDLKKTVKWPNQECIGQIDECIREIHEQRARFHRALDQLGTAERYPARCSGRMENPPQVPKERPECDELNTALYRGRIH